jgi:hypothetical protein
VTPQASTVHRLVSFWSDYSVLLVSWEVGSCQGRVQAFRRVILHCEAGSGMHSHLREAGFTQLWWIQGMISATLTAVGVDKTTKGLLQWDISS